MRVARILQADSPTAPTLAAARERWLDWMEHQPQIGVVDDPVTLPAWIVAHPERADVVLRALIRIGADDRCAVTFVCWLMKPAAVRIAAGLADADESIDEIVASHLWTVVAETDPQSPAPVAGSIKRATLRGVQAELGIGEGARRSSPMSARTTPVDDADLGYLTALQAGRQLSGGYLDGDPRTDLLTNAELSSLELARLLQDAVSSAVISESERQVLIDLMVTAHESAKASGPWSGRACGSGGLMARPVLTAVGERHGVGATTICRRSAAAMKRLRAFATEEKPHAA